VNLTSNPNKFAELFNRIVPGAYRSLTAQDVRDMSKYGLIGRYDSFFDRSDLQTVMAIIQCEQLRLERLQKAEQQDSQELPQCKRCGELLPQVPEGQKGRPREYCSDCEPYRLSERQKKLRKNRRHSHKTCTAIL